jgi:hypothetical protein
MGIAMADITEDTLVIEDRKRTVWTTRAFGALFTVVPVLGLLLIVFGAIKEPQKFGFGLPLAGLLILGFVALSGYGLLMSDQQLTTFDRATRQITVLVSNPQRQLTETYSFADVQSVGVVQWPGTKGKVVIRPVLNLTGDREVHTIGQSLPRADAEAAVASIAQFLAVPQDTLRDGRVLQLEAVNDADGKGKLRIGPDLNGHWIARAFGLFLAMPVLWGLQGIVSRAITGPAKVDVLSLLIGGLALGGFAVIALQLMLATTKSTTVDTAHQQIKLQQADCLGRHAEQVIAFRDVQSVGIVALKSWRSRGAHQPMLTLRDGREFRVASAQPFNDAERTAARLAKVVGVPVVAL